MEANLNTDWFLLGKPDLTKGPVITSTVHCGLEPIAQVLNLDIKAETSSKNSLSMSTFSCMVYPGCQRSSRSPAARSVRASGFVYDRRCDD